MDDPVAEIPPIIHLLTQSPPSLQAATIERYFTSDAAFSHPFCRTWSGPGSRRWVQATYRWYKIMSPRIDLSVQSVAFDEKNLKLYVSIFQIFRIWLVPFYYAPVHLTTVLTLRRGQDPTSPSPSPSPSATLKSSPESQKYFIHTQEDLYQIDQWIRFLLPGGWLLICAWWAWATFFCWIGCSLLWPVTWVEEHWWSMKSGEVREDGLTGREVLDRSVLRGRVLG